MYIDLHGQYPLLFSDFNANLNFLDSFFFEKYSKIKLHYNPSSGSPVVSCGLAGGRTTLIVAFLDFANTPKNSKFSVKHNTYYVHGYRVSLRLSLNEIYAVFD